MVSAGSPVKTSSAVLNNGKCKLASIHFCSTGTATLKIYDHNSTTVGSADEVARLILTANSTIEFDMRNGNRNNSNPNGFGRLILLYLELILCLVLIQIQD